MKTFFENPEIEVIKFSAMEDVLTSSSYDDETDPDENAGPEMPF